MSIDDSTSGVSAHHVIADFLPVQLSGTRLWWHYSAYPGVHICALDHPGLCVDGEYKPTIAGRESSDVIACALTGSRELRRG